MHKTDGRKKENPKQTTTQLICLRQYSTRTGTEVQQCATCSEQEERKRIRTRCRLMLQE